MIPLRILYQDEHLVAIDKPAGMIVHPGRDPEESEWIAMKRVRDELNQQVYVLHRQTLEVVSGFGQGGHWAGQFYGAHNLAIDSKGNLFIGGHDV